MQDHSYSDSFDFDGWARLARTDRPAFERKRKRTIEAVIADAPARNQAQLRRMQWKLDRIREVSPTPLAACVRMQEMMWDSVLGDDGLLARLQQLPPDGPAPANTAKILEFRR